MFELMDSFSQTAVIKVIGVGGGGGNAVSHMAKSGIEGVEFICVNTDAQALKHSQVKTSLQIGCNITKGLGAGANPEVGRQAAMEDRDRIIELIEGCDMLFITAGMGGGTGHGRGAGRRAGRARARDPDGRGRDPAVHDGRQQARHGRGNGHDRALAARGFR
jgi:cell division GTPase FtsZ